MREEYDSIRSVFERLGNADIDLFRNLAEAAVFLQQEADVVLEFVLKGNEKEARKRVLSAVPVLTPLRKSISKTMQALYSTHCDLMDIAGAVV